MSMQKTLDEVSDAVLNAAQKTREPRTRVMTAPSQLVSSTVEFRRLEAELEAAKKAGAGGVVLKLDSIRPSPYQVGGLQEHRIQGLVENLRVNPLSSPIAVREIAPGVYETLAGHHRTEAYRRLGRDEIRAVVLQFTDDEAERLVFFDNLLAPSLSDYAKYLGFSRRKDSKGLTLEQVAEEAGVSVSQVAKLLQFKRLPAAALALVEGAEHALSYTTMSLLAPYCDEQPEKVTECVAQLIQGKLSPAQIERWFAKQAAPAAVPAAPEKVVFKAGKAKYAEVTHRPGQMLLRFASEQEAVRMRSAVEALIAEQAKAQSKAG